ncbi:MAG TPA: Spy/CpxP family protein refolding chaperone [Bryobacteraceae bacterium]|jgi:Spy/CpxP family protein refolding chaperone|nr:Spy/CpxP family protein refolding chaperone [Bryobacteraceae bacterium]
MKRQIVKLAALGSIAAGLIFAQAQTQPQAGQTQNQTAPKAQAMHKGNRRMAGHRRMMEALNLTADQKATAKSLFEQARETAKPARAELRQNRAAMAVAVKANDKAQIDRLSAERGKLMAKISAGRGEAMAKFYQALTPAQRAKADQMQARFQARMRQLREHRGVRTNG